MKLRYILDVLLAISVLQAWWFIAVPVAIYVAVVFESPLEIIVAGVAYDALYLVGSPHGVWSAMGTLISLLLYVLAVITRRSVRWRL